MARSSRTNMIGRILQKVGSALSSSSGGRRRGRRRRRSGGSGGLSGLLRRLAG